MLATRLPAASTTEPARTSVRRARMSSSSPMRATTSSAAPRMSTL
jgi:hypothetical protein